MIFSVKLSLYNVLEIVSGMCVVLPLFWELVWDFLVCLLTKDAINIVQTSLCFRAYGCAVLR